MKCNDRVGTLDQKFFRLNEQLLMEMLSQRWVRVVLTR